MIELLAVLAAVLGMGVLACATDLASIEDEPFELGEEVEPPRGCTEWRERDPDADC